MTSSRTRWLLGALALWLLHDQNSFIGTQSSRGLQLRAAPETVAEVLGELPKMAAEDWAIGCNKYSNISITGLAVNSILMRYKHVAVDARGAEGVAVAYRLMKWNHKRMKIFLEDLGFQIAFYVQKKAVTGKDGASSCLRFHAQAIPLPDLQPPADLPNEEVLLAPKVDEAISRTASAMKTRLMEKGFARLQGIGPQSMNRLMKATIRANEYLKSDLKEKSDEDGFFMWIVPHETLEVSEKDGKPSLKSSCMDLVKGPKPMT